MNALIIYYSQSGNTRKIARAVARGMGGLVESCDVVPVKGLDPHSLETYDLIGLGTPVWNGGEPPNVRKFLDDLPEQKGRHLFSFNTHGVMPELYFPSMVRKLKAKGFTVIGTKDWYGNCIIQTFPSPYFTGGHPDEIDMQEAEEFGRVMVDRSRRISQGESDLVPPVPDHVLTPQLLALVEFYRSGHNAHGRLTYNPEKCNYPKCHLCVDNCVMQYIDLSQTPRRYGSEGDACDMWMGCTFCESICPTGAISADWGAHFARMKPIFAALGMEGEDLLAKVIDEAEAAGRFRRLVPTEEIRPDRPFFMVHAKHPRFRIPKDE